jgi:hypothetical protein
MGRRITPPHHKTRSEYDLPKRPTSPSTNDAVRPMYYRAYNVAGVGNDAHGNPVGIMLSRWSLMQAG